MKTVILKAHSYLFAMLLTASMMSCQKASSDDTPNPSGPVSILGKWKITLFQEDEKNETSNFAGYTFDFIDDGTIIAVKGSITISGKHYKGNDDSKVKYIIDFGNASPLNELNEDWEIIEQSASKIHLLHVSGGNGGIDDLVFEK